jgi:YD repeat-containing protein
MVWKETIRRSISLCLLAFIVLYCEISYSATITYNYDNLNRLTKVVYGDGTAEEFTYDAAGNRLTNVIKGSDTQQEVSFALTPPVPSGLNSSNYVAVTYFSNGVQQQVNLDGTTSIKVMADVGSTYTYAVTSSASTTSHRWATGDPPTGIVDPGLTSVSKGYYEQYLATVNLNGTDSDHTVSTEARVLFGQSVTEQNLQGSWSGWCDAASTLRFSEKTTGTPARAAQSERSWTVNSALSTTINYSALRQVIFSLSAPVPVGLNSSNYVAVNYVSNGQPKQVNLRNSTSVSVVADVGSTYTYAVTSSGSTTSHRWATGDPPTGIVDPGLTSVSKGYYEQYYVTVNLNGTDSDHSVGTEAHWQFNKDHRESGQYTSWSDWCDRGSKLTFGQATTGTPPKTTASQRSWTVTTALSPAINYSYPSVRVTFRAMTANTGSHTHMSGTNGPTVTYVTPDGTTGYAYPYDGKDEVVTVKPSSPWSYDQTSSGSDTTTHRWYCNDTNLGGYAPSSASQTVTKKFYEQYMPTVTLNGVDSEYMTKTTVHRQFNKDHLDPNLSTSPWSDWCDAGSTLTFAQTTTGSPARTTADKRSWVVSSAFPATINYPSVKVTFRAVTANSGSHSHMSATNGPTVTYVAPDGTTGYAYPYDGHDEVVTVKPSSPWSYDQTSSGSDTSTHRWYCNDTNLGGYAPPLVSQTVTKNFYDQYMPVVTLNGIDSEHTTRTTAHQQFNKGHLDSNLGTSPWSDWCDAGSTLTFAKTTTGSPAKTTADKCSWVVSSAFSTTINYPSVKVTFRAVTINSGSHTHMSATNRPTVTYVKPDGTTGYAYPYDGKDEVVTVKPSSPWSYDRTSSGSDTTTHRWYCNDTNLGGYAPPLVSQTVTKNFYEQYMPVVALNGIDSEHTTRTTAHQQFNKGHLDSNLGTSPWSDWCDAGSTLTFAQTTKGSPAKTTADKRSWVVSSAFSATINYPSVKVTFRAVTANSGLHTHMSATNGPMVTYVKPDGTTGYAYPYDGKDEVVTATPSSPWSYDRTSSGSDTTTHRWYCNDTNLGGYAPPLVSQTVTKNFYEQYMPVVTLNGIDSEHTTRTTAHQQFNKGHLDSNLGTSPWSDWCDAGSTLTFAQTTTGSPAKKTTDKCSWTKINSAFTAAINYFFPSVAMTFRAVTVNSGLYTDMSATNGPTVTYVKPDGTTGYAYPYDGYGEPVAVKPSSKWSYSQTSSGSDTTTHRWYCNNTTLAGTATTSVTQSITKNYYEQFRKSFGAGTPNPGTPMNSSNYVTIEVYQFAKKLILKAWDNSPGTGWVDAGSTYTYAQQSTGSGSTQRWRSQTQKTGTVTDNNTISWTYYHQYKPVVTLNGTDSGHTVSTEAHSQFNMDHLDSGLYKSWSDWCDARSMLTFSQKTTGSPSGTTSGKWNWLEVNSAFTATINYTYSPRVLGYVATNEIKEINDLDLSFCTDLIVSFCYFNPDATEYSEESILYHEMTDKGSRGALLKKAKAANKKVLLGVGGGGDDYKNGFQNLVNKAELDHQKLVDAVKALRKIVDKGENNIPYDGIDIDWEWPEEDGGFKKLMEVIFNEFDDKIVSVAISGDLDVYDFPALRELKPFKLDYCNLMEYDYNAKNPELPNSPIDGIRNNCEAVISAGVDITKINVILPYYARYGSNDEDLYRWGDIRNTIACIVSEKDNDYGFNDTFLERKIEKSLWKDAPASMADYFYVVDPYSMFRKVRYLTKEDPLENGNIRGVGIWQLGQQDFDPHSKLEMGKAILAGLAGTKPEEYKWPEKPGPCVDLVETFVSNPPLAAKVGSTFSVMDTVENQGSADAGPSTTRYYLSSDTIKGNGDILLTGRRSVPGLAPGATSTGMVNVTIPSNTAAGTYNLLACADDTMVVAESYETNNCIPSSSTVQVIKP